VKLSYRPLVIFATTAVLLGGSTLRRRLTRSVRQRLSSMEELKSRRWRKKHVARNGLAVKSRPGCKKLNCEAGIDS
jgi:hypothetical protein